MDEGKEKRLKELMISRKRKFKEVIKLDKEIEKIQEELMG